MERRQTWQWFAGTYESAGGAEFQAGSHGLSDRYKCSGAYNEQFEIKSEAEAVEEISCQPDIAELAAASALLYVVLGAAVWLETRKILGNGSRELLG